LATGFATNVPLLLVASFAVGATTIVPQLLIPFAAGLVPVTERGRVVGSIQGGLLIGVLLSRTISGWVGAHFGWRSMFVIAAGLMLALFVVLYRLLPSQPPAAPTPYLPLLRSLWTLWREEPLIRLHATLGALTFAGFSAFWATLALQLDALPAHYGPAVAGTFGLVGVVGASAAPVVGRFADRTAGQRIQAVGITAVLLAFVLFWIGGRSLVGLAAGVILLDFGAQANHVANQARIFTLRTEAHSRVNTLYMTTYIGGGALGAYLGALGSARFGWAGVCAVGGAAALLGLLRVAVPVSTPPPTPA
jgi:predicted MFS family arabinose efflux permease